MKCISKTLVLTIFLTTWMTLTRAQEKFVFSDSPFTSVGATKIKFNSSEFIYGRVDLPQSLKDFFDLENGDGQNYPRGVLMMDLKVLDEQGTELGAIAGKFIKPTSDQINDKYLIFDVNPSPTKATTLMSMVASFDLGFSSVPSAQLFDQRSYYGRVPQLKDGKTYKVDVSFSRWSFDPYSPNVPRPSENWNRCTGSFELVFSSKDIPALIKNNKAADDLVKDNANKKNMASRGLPDEWNLWKGPNTTGHTEKQLTDMFLRTRGEPGPKKVFKVVIADKPGGALWDIRRDNGININARYCNQTVGFFAQVEGKCYLYRTSVRETYLGDKYDTDNAYIQVMQRVDVDCKFIPSATPVAK